MQDLQNLGLSKGLSKTVSKMRLRKNISQDWWGTREREPQQMELPNTAVARAYKDWTRAKNCWNSRRAEKPWHTNARGHREGTTTKVTVCQESQEPAKLNSGYLWVTIASGDQQWFFPEVLLTSGCACQQWPWCSLGMLRPGTSSWLIQAVVITRNNHKNKA